MSYTIPNNKPRQVVITELDGIIVRGNFIKMKSAHENIIVTITPHVAIKMVEWLCKENYIIVDGLLTLKVRTVRRTYGTESKTQKAEKISSTIG